MTNWWTRQQLKSGKPEARRKAVEKLALKESAETLLELAAVSDDPDPEVRLAVVKALGQSQGDVAGLLMNALRDAEPGIREQAVIALEHHGDPICVEALVPLISDRSLAVCRRAARALVRFKWKPDKQAQSAKLAVALGEYSRAALIGPAAIEALVAVINNKDWPERRLAVEALSTIEDTRILTPLIATLKDRDPHVRVAAIEALERVRSPKAIDPLAGLLKDRDPIVRAAAINTLARLPVGAAIERIAAALKDPHWSVRKSAVEALARAKDPRAVPALAALLDDEDTDVRVSAIESLAKIQDKSVVEKLVLKLTDPQHLVRQAANSALDRIDPNWLYSDAAPRALPVLNGLQGDRDYWVRHTATDLVRRINTAMMSESHSRWAEPPPAQWPNASVDDLLSAAQDVDREVRQAAVEALSGQSDVRAVEALQRALDDTDLWVRRAAARGLQIVEGPAGGAETPMAS
jgi:HEAT repeat protein